MQQTEAENLEKKLAQIEKELKKKKSENEETKHEVK